MSTSRHSNIFATHTFPAVLKEGELLMNMSYDFAEADDGKGNPIKVYIWINGTWKIEYKGREFLMTLNDNLAALVKWVNSQNDTVSDGTEGQDRDNYTDDQDRENYTVSE